MTVYRRLLQSFRRSNYSSFSSSICTFSKTLTTLTAPSTTTTTFTRSYAFSSAEEPIAKLRRRKCSLRMEPPLHAIRPDLSAPRRPRDANPRFPDSISALVGRHLKLHNRVQSLIHGGDLDAASAVARESVFTEIRPTVFTCNAIIESMYRASRYDEAIGLFQYFFDQSNIIPNIVSYNNLINTHCDLGQVDIALDVYQLILGKAPFSPSPVSYRHLTKGLVKADRIAAAVDLLREMLNKGYGADSRVYNNIISGYLNLENFKRANELFDELRQRCQVYDGIVNATFMEWFFKKGTDDEAMESYQGLLDRQFRMVPGTCNVLLRVLLKYGKGDEAKALFQAMLNNHRTPYVHAVNTETCNIMVNECFRLGKFSEGLAVFRQTETVLESKPFQMDGAGYTNIIGRLCENGMVAEAHDLFEEMSSKSVIMNINTFRFLIEAYFKEGMVDEVVQKLKKFLYKIVLDADPLFFKMVFDGLISNGRIKDLGDIVGQLGINVKLDLSTYELVITVLCQAGNLGVSWSLLIQMVNKGIGVSPKVHNAVKEAFAKDGKTYRVEKLFGVLQLVEGAYVCPQR